MFERALECRCCRGRDIVPYLDLGEQPLANAYHGGQVQLARFPLQANLCRTCGHSQLSIVVDRETLFRHYLYVSGTTVTFRQHCHELAQDAVGRLRVKHPRVLEIACNDGTLLGFFRDFGCDVQGVDPAQNLRAITEAKGIPVLTDFWSGQAAARVLEGGAFDLVVGTNVLGHVHDPLGFLACARRVLKPAGLVLLEFPYGDETIERCEFDQIYHEHLSYFLVGSFARLVELAGFTIVDVLRTPIHGGSIRFFLRADGAASHCREVERLIESEARKGLHCEQTYLRFGARVAENGRALRSEIDRARAEGRRVVGYGASAKGNTMLNYFQVDLDYVVDDNPLKHGLLTPGRDLPIRSPEVLRREDGALAIVVLAWNFLDEIQRRVRVIRGEGRGDRYILYVPKVRAIEESALATGWAS